MRKLVPWKLPCTFQVSSPQTRKSPRNFSAVSPCHPYLNILMSSTSPLYLFPSSFLLSKLTMVRTNSTTTPTVVPKAKPYPKWFHKTSKPPNLNSSTPPPMSPPPPPSPKQEQLQHVFYHFDSDGDGKISSLELRAYFGSIGEYMSHEQAQDVINELDVDGDGLLDFDDFMRLMEKDGGEEDLRKAFEMFEAEKGSGCITPKSLQRTLCQLGDTKSYEECEKMIRVYDLDGNGIVDFHEFHCMMA